MHKQRPQGLKKSIQLNVEKLECRRLLAGLSVSVSIDTSLTGNLQSETDVPAANRILYIDLNRNGLADANEPVAITDQAGQAFFAGLEAGDYSIGLLTDNIRQRQTSPAVVAQTQELAVPLPSQYLIGGTGADQALWALSSDGILTLVSDSSHSNVGNPVHISILEIGGQPESVVHRTPSEAWISFRTASQSRLAIFNTATRQLTSYFVSGTSRLVDLASDGQSIFGVSQEANQSKIVRIEASPTGLKLTEIATGQFQEIEALANNLLAIRQAEAGQFVDLLDLNGTRLDSVPVGSSASGLQVEQLSQSVVVNSVEGTAVFRAANNSLTKLALIAEATAPIALSAGRMIAADRSRRGELTVWNMASWSPTGNFSVGEADIRHIQASGLTARVLTEDSVHTLDLAAARPVQITLGNAFVAEAEPIRFSVHPLRVSSAPSVEAPPLRSVSENQSDKLDLRQIVADANGQMLWFSLVAGPTHGSVQLKNNGLLEFTPAADFFGTDSVKVRVHDGVSSADVSLNWNIIEANRPPVAMNVLIDQMPEGLPAGTVVGTVSIVDPNTNDSYRITSADYRFRVEGGKVILNEPLDFEAGSSIVLDLTAIDALGQFSISSSTIVRLTNVHEPPAGVVLSELSVSENISDVMVGKLAIVSPDAAGQYQFSVDDARFVVRGDELWLMEPLNYEQARSVKLSLSAKDTNHPQFVVISTVELAVINQDDSPTEIRLNSRKVAEQTAGAEVGLISVVDEDGDVYQYQISDGRFVVSDGVLRLTENTTLDRNEEQSISITITATSTSGGIIVFTFPLTVVPPPSPWQNPSNPIDVNGDNIITPTDALYVINFLNEHGSGQIPESEPGGSGERPIYPDVNGDGRITPVDALIIINELNDRSRSAGERDRGNRLSGEGEAASVGSAGSATAWQFTSWNAEDERRRNNSRIDAELELLLEQLANDSA